MNGERVSSLCINILTDEAHPPGPAFEPHFDRGWIGPEFPQIRHEQRHSVTHALDVNRRLADAENAATARAVCSLPIIRPAICFWLRVMMQELQDDAGLSDDAP